MADRVPPRGASSGWSSSFVLPLGFRVHYFMVARAAYNMILTILSGSCWGRSEISALIPAHAGMRRERHDMATDPELIMSSLSRASSSSPRNRALIVLTKSLGSVPARGRTPQWADPNGRSRPRRKHSLICSSAFFTTGILFQASPKTAPSMALTGRLGCEAPGSPSPTPSAL
jgi:hypothetical protein